MGAALTASLGPAPGEDAVALAAVVALVREVMGAGAALGWSGVPDEEAAGRWWLGLLADVAAGRAAVAAAYDGERLVGLGEWRRHPLPPQAQNADIEKVFVSGRCRGSGVGALVMDELIRAAYLAGVETLTLECRGNNLGAIRFYRRLGFHEYGRLSDFVASGPDRWDKVLMARDLRSGDEQLQRHGSDPVGEGASS